MRDAALADVKQAEDEIKRSFRPNFNVENLDIPSIREKRRMEIEEAVRKEREENMNSPFKGPVLRNAGKLASELGSNYEAKAGGSGLEGMEKGSKALSWHEQVQRELAAGKKATEYQEEMRREIEENAAWMEEDEDDDEEDETQVVNLLALELAQQKEQERRSLVEKHSTDLRKQAEDHSRLVAQEGDDKAEIFADALAAANVQHTNIADKENIVGNLAVDANCNSANEGKKEIESFWDTMEYVHSPMERRYNRSDAPEDIPVFHGVDMESVLLQSLTVAFKPDEFLRKDKEKQQPYNPKHDIRDIFGRFMGRIHA